MALIKLNNRGVKDATAFGSISSLGSLVFISKQTASSSATISFTSGIDSTYKEYIFYFVNMHPATDQTDFTFQANVAGGADYNETITSTNFYAFHSEGDYTTLTYNTADDQANGTAFQPLITDMGNANDESMVGYLHLFNPSSTTFVKHFISRMQGYNGANAGSLDMYSAGYFNTTSAIDEIQFKMASGNIDSGQILLFGLN